MSKYTETLDYLYHQLPMFQRVGAAAFKKNLDNIKALCKHLGQPQKQFPSIHLAGTNGKGSTAHLISSVLQAKGLKVGLYTSPHYRDFRERIKINGEYIPKHEVIHFVKEHRAAFEKIQPSFFEITVAMAFQYFAQQEVDVAIIETGLGGRLDSTNVIVPLLSIITNISFDHQQFLGNTLVKIAGEKAGIIKKGVPVIIGEEQKACKKVFQERAKKKAAKLYFASRYYQLHLLDKTEDKSIYQVTRRKETYFDHLEVEIHGAYQEKNIATALMAVERLQQMKLFADLTADHVRAGFKNLKARTNFKGRWQYISHAPRILADSAHNKAGLELAVEALRDLEYDQLHFVLGTVNDKDIDQILTLLPKEAIYYFAKANIPRGLAPEVLQEKGAQAKLHGRTYSSVRNALKAAKRRAKPQDLIYVGGSIFVVAEVID